MSYEELLERLRKGFYVDNLYEMARLCRSLALDAYSPAPLFIMERIFLDIARHWEERPVTVEESKLVESKLIKPFGDLLGAIAANAPSEEIFSLANRLVSAYLISPISF